MTELTAIFILLTLSFSIAVSSIVPNPKFQIFFVDEVLPMFSQNCSEAMAANFNCLYIETSWTTMYGPTYLNSEDLQAMCTESCLNSIEGYRANIMEICQDETYVEPHDGSNLGQWPMSPDESALILKPIVLVDYMFTNFRQRCLKDSSGNFCYLRFADEAKNARSRSEGGMQPVKRGGAVIPANGGVEDQCDECQLGATQLQLSNPQFYDDDLATSFAARASSCGMTDFALAEPTHVSAKSLSPTSTPLNFCTGRTVTIRPNDDCDTIAARNNISTWDLLQTNQIAGGCSQFPQSGTVCIDTSWQCVTYLVKSTDTCASIATDHEITTAQLGSWNPPLRSPQCTNLYQSVGHYICVSDPSGYVLPSYPKEFSIGVNEPAEVPENLAPGTTTRCSVYYSTAEGESSSWLAHLFGLSEKHLVFLNPSLRFQTDPLPANQSYCWKPFGDIRDYPGYYDQEYDNTGYHYYGEFDYEDDYEGGYDIMNY